MKKTLRRIGLAAAVVAMSVVVAGTSKMLHQARAAASGSSVVASGSGAGFVSQIFTVASTGSYDFRFNVRSAAGYCALGWNGTPGFNYESAAISITSDSNNTTAANFNVGPLVAWEAQGESLGVSGDQQVNLAAGKWTLRINWQCFNGGALASPWSYTIS